MSKPENVLQIFHYRQIKTNITQRP